MRAGPFEHADATHARSGSRARGTRHPRLVRRLRISVASRGEDHPGCTADARLLMVTLAATASERVTRTM
jgi:hypothetical protein